MGGFEWGTKVAREKCESIEGAVVELREWAKRSDIEAELRYLTQELSDIQVIKPEQRDETYWYEIKQTLCGEVRIPKETYSQNFGEEFPKEGEILVYCWEIPWLWKFRPATIAKVAECFERHGVLEVWWDIIGYNSKVNDLHDRFWREHAKEIFGEGTEVIKNKPYRE
jgi:hypothetical protein